MSTQAQKRKQPRRRPNVTPRGTEALSHQPKPEAIGILRRTSRAKGPVSRGGDPLRRLRAVGFREDLGGFITDVETGSSRMVARLYKLLEALPDFAPKSSGTAVLKRLRTLPLLAAGEPDEWTTGALDDLNSELVGQASDVLIAAFEEDPAPRPIAPALAGLALARVSKLLAADPEFALDVAVEAVDEVRPRVKDGRARERERTVAREVRS